MNKLFKSSLFIISLIFLSNFGFVLLAVYLTGVLSFKIALYLFAATSVSSALAVTILGGLFTSLSSYILSLRRLFRLDNLTHPLLLRLSTEAPGTYHHSILVANLSSKAAKAIGADSLLCRVASYFHDIGKLKNPGFFIENQTVRINSLESQSNNLLNGAKKILEHVQEGVNIAEKNHLPKEIINLIAQHHGNSLCSYFYQLAKEKNPLKAKRSDFRYEGPKPQTKESAILMLADSLEAKIRAKNDISDLKKLVEGTFLDKIQDKQLIDSQLSQKEIFKLKKVFEKAIESMFHPRIEYP